MGTQQGTGFPGQIQVRDPDTLQPQDVFGDANVVRVGLRYYDGSGVPQAQPQIATAEQITDQRKHYLFVGLLEDGTDTYVGYEDKDGNWYIMKIDTNTDATYLAGTGNLPEKSVANWVTGKTYQAPVSAF